MGPFLVFSVSNTKFYPYDSAVTLIHLKDLFKYTPCILRPLYNSLSDTVPTFFNSYFQNTGLELRAGICNNVDKS